MIRIYKIIITIFLILTLNSCNLESVNVKKNLEKKAEKNIENNIYPFYYIGDSYYIDGVKYIPKENYLYKEEGTATFFDPSLHGKRTISNEIIDVTSLTGAHKTLPIPSVVKITNLDNLTFLIIRINNRGPDNNKDIIMVSMKVAKLLNFYDTGYANVRLEILKDESIQLKKVTESINVPIIDDTIDSVPAGEVNITNLD